GFAGPGGALNHMRSGLELGAVAGRGNGGLHGERGERVRVFGLDRFAGFAGRVGKAIAGAHEVAFGGLVENRNFSEPFAGRGSDPAGSEGAGGVSMMRGDGRAVHVGGDQSIGVESLL